MAQLAARRSHNPKVASSILAGSMSFLFFASNTNPRARAPPKTRQPATGFPPGCVSCAALDGETTSSTQRSVQIVLIFRLLLKITVDWPFYAINLCL